MWESHPLILLLVIYIAMQGLVAPSVKCMWRAVGYECLVISLLVWLPGWAQVWITGGSFPVSFNHSSHLALNSILSDPMINSAAPSTGWSEPRVHWRPNWDRITVRECQWLHVATFLQQREQKISLGNTSRPPIQPYKMQYCNQSKPILPFYWNNAHEAVW